MAGLPEGNVYVRLSLMQPKPGQDTQVTGLLNDLLGFYAQQPGYIRGFALTAPAREKQIGRLTFWATEHDAENVANTQHSMALRSQLNGLIETGSHLERAFVAEETSPLPP